MKQSCEVAVIGAGPAGAVAAALLKRQSIDVCVLEKQHFPRFVIGESLLPHCMEFIEEAGFLPAVLAEASFQFKNGAAFTWGERYASFDFTDKFSSGPGTTFQVRRSIFDQILINEAVGQGVDVRFGHTVTSFDDSGGMARLGVQPENGAAYEIQAHFVLDASGYGRVLPRLLDLETPSCLPVREAHFTHIDDNITAPDFDRNKILISTHPQYRDVWLWLIPFADGQGVDLSDLPLAVLQGFSDLIGEDVYQVLTPEGSLNARNHLGGTAPAQVRFQVARWKEKLADLAT